VLLQEKNIEKSEDKQPENLHEVVDPHHNKEPQTMGLVPQ